MDIRTRFAPSPTGYLHIGGARTALYSWLYARKHKGTFILRIEDTDLGRSTPEAVDAILAGMEWLQLNYDAGPFYQSDRFDRYATVIQQLLSEGKVYCCFCSKERLEELRETQMANKQKPRYDGRCRNLATHPQDKPFVIRFRNPDEGEVTFDDKVRGHVTFQNNELDDLIIARSDGTPTYNFTVVVDDMDMRITHVIRGDDHINNTPRQINILKALDANLPIYAHVPMILGADSKRLSKRHGAVSVLQYRDEGFLPEALINYLVRLGWSHGDQEIFSVDEMINLFNLDNLSRAPAAFNPEKLLWLNQHYIKTLAADYVAQHLLLQMNRLQINIANGPVLSELVIAQRERCKTLVEMAEKSRFLYEDKIIYDEKAAQQNLTPEVLPALQMLHENLSTLREWTNAGLHQIIHDVATALNLKLGKIAQPVRVAVTGNTISPPIDETLRLLGKQRTLERLQNAVEYIQTTKVLV